MQYTNVKCLWCMHNSCNLAMDVTLSAANVGWERPWLAWRTPCQRPLWNHPRVPQWNPSDPWGWFMGNLGLLISSSAMKLWEAPVSSMAKVGWPWTDTSTYINPFLGTDFSIGLMFKALSKRNELICVSCVVSCASSKALRVCLFGHSHHTWGPPQK